MINMLNNLEKECRKNGLMVENLDICAQEVLKIHRVESRKAESFIKFLPEKFLTICIEENFLQISTYSYNEQLINSRKLLFDDQINWRNLVEQIIQDLNSEQKLCQGIHIETMLVPDVSKILVESYSNKIIYRSRDCQRIIQSLESNRDIKNKMEADLCYDCTLLLHPVVKLEEHENSLLQDFTLVNPLQTNSLRKKSKKKNDNVEKEVKYNTDQLTCETCQKSYSSHRYLEMHKCKGTRLLNPEPIVCHFSECAKMFKSKSSLQDHLNSVHSKTKQYICPGCGKAHRTRQKSRLCEITHIGRFLHPCHLCEKKFNCKRRYHQHMRTHTGEKPFLCPLCSYRCSRMDNLNIHTKKSHGLSVHEAEQQTGVSARMQTDVKQDHRNVDKQNCNGQNAQYFSPARIVNEIPSNISIAQSNELINIVRGGIDENIVSVTDIDVSSSLDSNLVQAHQSIPGAAQRFLTFMPDNQHSTTIHIQKIHQNNVE